MPGADAVDLVAHVDAIGHRPLVGVLRDQVLVEEPERMLRWRGRQPDQEGIEILQHLPPQIVDRAVALVGHDEIVGLDRDVGVVLHRTRRSRLIAGAGRSSNMERSSSSSSISSPLSIEYSRWMVVMVTLPTGSIGSACQALDVVQLGEHAPIIRRDVALELA